MLLRILKGNYLFNYILFPLISVMLIFKALIHASGQTIQIPTGNSPIGMLLQIPDVSVLLSILINLLVVLIICIILFYVNARFSLVKDVSFLPSYLYLFIVLAFPEFHYIQPVLFSALFIALSFRSIFLSIGKKNIAPSSFDAGFLIGVASLFYFFASAMIFVVPLSIIVLRKSINWRNLSVTLLGLLLPWLLFYSYNFITDNPFNYHELAKQLTTQAEALFNSYLVISIYLGYILLITLISSFFILQQYDEKNINTRRFFKVLFIFFTTSLILLFLPAVSGEIIVLLTLPLTFLITNYLTFMKRRFWAEMFFTVLVIFSIILQFVY
ncbi:MAG: DUF6427 family protein [Prolixibacteraceae bacterium]|jgi:hypothetical protein|nr:DUF6427 family protein [Prolixibacteraceae bacterium]